MGNLYWTDATEPKNFCSFTTYWEGKATNWSSVLVLETSAQKEAGQGEFDQHTEVVGKESCTESILMGHQDAFYPVVGLHSGQTARFLLQTDHNI